MRVRLRICGDCVIDMIALGFDVQSYPSSAFRATCAICNDVGKLDAWMVEVRPA